MSVLKMKFEMKILAVLLCTAALGGCSLFSKKPAPAAAPVASAAPAAASALNTTPAAAAKAGAKTDGKGFLPPGESGNVAIDSIVVVVNDDVITQRELANRIKTVTARMKAQNVQMPDPADLRRQLLERMIVERAQLQMAKEMGVRVDDQQLDRAIGRIAEAQKLSVQDLRNQMEKDGTPYAAFREDIREEIIMQRLREHEVDANVQISDAEVDSFMAAEKAAAAEQFEINISQIMVRIPDNATAEVIAQRRARAEEVMRQLRTGADFAKMAATYSDASDALQGGVVGWRQPERLPPVFAEALTKLKPGQVTPIIKSVGAFHILKAVDRRSLAEAQAA